MTTQLGFIGLGLMGTPIATNLLEAGYAVTVHDLREDAVERLVAVGASPGTSARSVAEAAEIVFTSLPGPTQVEEVVLGPEGILDALRPGGVYIDLTTNAPTLIREIELRFRERGCHVLDAPLGGRSTLARTGQLQVMVGGDPEVFERCRPVLERIGNRVVHCGPIGSGMICKLMHNDINAVFRQVTAECFTAGVKAGVDAEVLWEVVRNGITCAGSEINNTMRNTWLRGEFDTGTGFLRTHYKDTALAAEIGRENGVPMAHTELTLERLTAALDRGWGGRDSTVSLLLQEELAGVEVRIPDGPPA
jgi:3-hydroxyisobutyrate dehydrogenase